MTNLFKIDLQEDEWVDQVFAGRNQHYGAYQLRKKYTQTVVLSGAIAVLSLTAVLELPLLAEKLHLVETGKIIPTVIDLTAQPLVDLPKPPPLPKATPRPPSRPKVTFTPPVVQSKVDESQIPPPHEATKTSDMGSQTTVGTPDDVEPPTEQTKTEAAGESIKNIFLSVESPPQYPGGETALMHDLNAYLQNHYPLPAKENGIEGQISVSFVVERDGTVSAVNAIRGQELGGGLAEAAITAVKKLKKFIPGRQNGNAVRVMFSVPVSFHLILSE